MSSGFARGGRLWDLPDPVAADFACNPVFDQVNDVAKDVLREWINAWPDIFEWKFAVEYRSENVVIACTRVTMDQRVWTSRDIIPVVKERWVQAQVTEGARRRFKEFADASAALARERERA